MLVESFGLELPSYLPTIVTFIVIGVAFYESYILLPKTAQKNQAKPILNKKLRFWTAKKICGTKPIYFQ